MKKLFLLLTLGASFVAGNAQLLSGTEKVKSAILVKGDKHITAGPYAPQSSTPTVNKTTAGGTRWYNHALSTRAYSNFSTPLSLAEFYDTLHAEYNPIWQDTSVTYSDGSGVFFLSIGQVFNPKASTFNEPSITENAGLMKVTNTNSYTIDSVKVRGYYSRKYHNYVDTLILSFVTETATAKYAFFSYAGSVSLNHGVDSFAAQLYSTSDYLVNPISQVPYGTNGTYMTGTQIKVPLTDATFADSLADGSHELKAKVGITVGAGRLISLSATFKSGTAYTSHTPFTNYNYFEFLSHEIDPGGYVFYPENDFNMSSFVTADSDMVNSSLGLYIPTIAYGAGLKAELHDISWKVSCSTCYNVGVNDVKKSFTSGIFPNPANTSITIPVTTTKTGVLNVKIVNTIGQTVGTQNFGTVTAGSTKEAKFNTSSLPTGIYIYVVDLDGERTSERFTVAH